LTFSINNAIVHSEIYYSFKNINNMEKKKILILANTKENVQRIKNDMKNIEKFWNENRYSWDNISNLAEYDVHEISDLVECSDLRRRSEEGGTPRIQFETDDRNNNRIDLTQFHVVLVYHRFANPWWAEHHNLPIPIAVPLNTLYPQYYGA